MRDLTKYRLCAGLPVPPAAKLIYCCLVECSENGSVILPVNRLAKAVGLSRAATVRNLHRLEHLNLISIRPRYSEDGSRLANRYEL